VMKANLEIIFIISWESARFDKGKVGFCH